MSSLSNITSSVLSTVTSSSSSSSSTVAETVASTINNVVTSAADHGDDHGETCSLEIFGTHTTEFSSLLLAALLFILFTSIARIIFHHLKITFMPESALVILLGVFFGLVLVYAFDITSQEVLTFNEEIFFLLLIPPIILEAGYHLQTDFFFGNMKLILVYAVVGTVLNITLTGVSIWLISGLFIYEISLAESLVFGSLISAVDPVAVLAIFEDIHVNETLNMLVFGESVLNDAVSIVLYNLFKALTCMASEDIDGTVPVLAVLKFSYVSFGGLVIGFVMALFAAWLTKWTDHIHLLEPLLIGICGILAYLVAEVLLMSGIVAILFAGIVMNRYAEANISSIKSHITTHYSLKLIASTAETLVFIYLGINSVTHLGTDRADGKEVWDSALIGFTLLFILPYRFLVVFFLTSLANRGRLIPVSKGDQFILAYGGLRGAIAFALAFTLPEAVESKPTLVTATLVVIWFTIFIQGTTMKPLIKLFGIKLSSGSNDNELTDTVLTKAFAFIVESVELINGKTGGSFDVWKKFDHWIYGLVVRGLYEEEKQIVDAIKNVRKREVKNLVTGDQEDFNPVLSYNLKTSNLQTSTMNLRRVMADDSKSSRTGPIKKSKFEKEDPLLAFQQASSRYLYYIDTEYRKINYLFDKKKKEKVLKPLPKILTREEPNHSRQVQLLNVQDHSDAQNSESNSDSSTSSSEIKEKKNTKKKSKSKKEDKENKENKKKSKPKKQQEDKNEMKESIENTENNKKSKKTKEDKMGLIKEEKKKSKKKK